MFFQTEHSGDVSFTHSVNKNGRNLLVKRFRKVTALQSRKDPPKESQCPYYVYNMFPLNISCSEFCVLVRPLIFRSIQPFWL